MSDTQLESFLKIQPMLGRLQQQVYELISASPRTCFEIEQVTGLTHQSASARINELVNMGRVGDSGRRAWNVVTKRRVTVWSIKE